jgi:hypothetical protein
VGLALQLEVPTVATDSIPDQKAAEASIPGQKAATMTSIQLEAAVAATSEAAQLRETLPMHHGC